MGEVTEAIGESDPSTLSSLTNLSYNWRRLLWR